MTDTQVFAVETAENEGVDVYLVAIANHILGLFQESKELTMSRNPSNRFPHAYEDDPYEDEDEDLDDDLEDDDWDEEEDRDYDEDDDDEDFDDYDFEDEDEDDDL